MQVADRELTIRGQRLAYREWGEASAAPVLALHGWLDNATSFDALARQLPGQRIIAVDMPGHGLSGHRPPSGTYNIWDDLPDLSLLADALALQQFALIGHSRGAMIASLLAATEPERVSSLVLLDGMLAPGLPDDEVVKQLSRFVHDYGRRVPGAGKVYASVDEALDARCRATGFDREAGAQLVPRSLEAVDGGYRWRNDPRLRYASATKFQTPAAERIAAAVAAPTLVFIASQGHGPRIRDSAVVAHFPDIRFEDVDGCHHCHMLQASTLIATRIREFWRAVDPARVPR